MSIILNDNIEAKAPKPLDKYEGPWESVNAALIGVPINVRFKGRTVKILENGLAVEYWWADGVNLTKKSITNKFDTEITVNGAVQSKYPYGIIVNYDQNRNPKLSYNSKVVAVADTLSEYGVSLKLPAGSTDPGVRPWYGPYVALENGNYNWTVYNRISDNTKPGSLLYVDINETGGTAPRGTIASKVVKYSDFSADSTIWLATVLNFTARKGYNYEARIDIARDTVQPYPTLVDIWLDYGVLSPFTASAGHSADEYLKTTFYTTQTSNFNLVNAMAGTTVRCNATGNITATLNDSNQFAIGDKITIRMSGTGGVTLAAGPDITLNAPQGLVLSRTYSYLEIVKQAANVYSVTIMGDDPTKVDLNSLQELTNKTFADTLTITGPNPKLALGTSSSWEKTSLYNNLYATNKVLQPGAQGKALDLNGSTQFAYNNTNFTGLSSVGQRFSVSMWIKTTSSATMTLFRWGIAAANTQVATAMALMMENGGFRFRGNSPNPTVWGSGYNDGQYHNVVFIFSGTINGTIYVDGIPLTSTAYVSHNAQLTNNPITKIGGDGSSTTTNYLPFNGTIDQVLFYSVNISSTDIANIYNKGSGTPSPPTANLTRRWEFDDGIGSTATDYYNPDYNLTLVGVPAWNQSGKIYAAGSIYPTAWIGSMDGFDGGDRGIAYLGEDNAQAKLIGQAIIFQTGSKYPFRMGLDGGIVIGNYNNTDRDINKSFNSTSWLDFGPGTASRGQFSLRADTTGLPALTTYTGVHKWNGNALQVVDSSGIVQTYTFNSQQETTLTKTANYTVLLNDFVLGRLTLYADASAGAITITLPSAIAMGSSSKTCVLNVIKTDSSANAVVISGGSVNINASTIFSLTEAYISKTFRSNGTQYFAF
ncbi:LamG domain-containing protein [Mucilaginibacter lacusdianchii]|uniref:LamG domain-containing protein n=1 Tax=Mucilaginibacter lacusdianchii TaxID=2684211 RepID=UPI00131C41B7|nr:LamG domain-containing protein [Mucilaginibacter sp. JXJ CY 39]